MKNFIKTNRKKIIFAIITSLLLAILPLGFLVGYQERLDESPLLVGIIYQFEILPIGHLLMLPIMALDDFISKFNCEEDKVYTQEDKDSWDRYMKEIWGNETIPEEHPSPFEVGQTYCTIQSFIFSNIIRQSILLAILAFINMTIILVFLTWIVEKLYKKIF